MSDADKATSRKSSPCGEDEGHPTPPPGPRLSGKDAQQLMAHTYYGLRWGLAVLAFVFPLSLSIGAHWFNKDHDLPTSISGYYHTGMRNYFVATLVALGLFLILYKGFSNWESRLLNIAGVAAIGVAFLPTGRDRGATDLTTTFTAPQLHGICALATFSCVGAVAIFLGPATLDLITDARLRTMLGNAYRALGGLMILLPLACLFVSRNNDWSLFYTEWAAVWVFVAYWGVKTLEFRHNDAETKALQGELPRAGATPNQGTSLGASDVTVRPQPSPRAQQGRRHRDQLIGRIHDVASAYAIAAVTSLDHGARCSRRVTGCRCVAGWWSRQVGAPRSVR